MRLDHMCLAVDTASIVKVKDYPVLPPKAIEVEPDLPAWSPSMFEGVADKPEPVVVTDPVTQTITGLVGLVVGILVSFLRGRLGQR